MPAKQGGRPECEWRSCRRFVRAAAAAAVAGSVQRVPLCDRVLAFLTFRARRRLRENRRLGYPGRYSPLGAFSRDRRLRPDRASRPSPANRFRRTVRSSGPRHRAARTERRVYPLHLLVLALGTCRWLAWQFVQRQHPASLPGCNMDVFQAFGGSPRTPGARRTRCRGAKTESIRTSVSRGWPVARAGLAHSGLATMRTRESDA